MTKYYLKRNQINHRKRKSGRTNDLPLFLGKREFKPINPLPSNHNLHRMTQHPFK
ncbi:hypothetical protein NKR17_19485 [Priestia flexa]|uniref:Uncharacterized protein n=1 Tax=Priestia flexa TaxID=86664 RepID=A0A1N6PFU3_9BACI|nr:MULTISPECIES: hypothetical protein [Priestia]MBN8252953.1 hypothetical protein [Priestia flexa]MCA1202355.1 hypothetical protein [Priestia flexa]MCG7313523.1 hypothetical protein [Priestia flexa]MCP1191213.1 hypothetical protein [Priestia flexa]SCB99851.1 hypothetical protein GA0061087_100712 [Priestia flexa]